MDKAVTSAGKKRGCLELGDGDMARGACGAGRAALLDMPEFDSGAIDKVTHAPQASNGISWRDAADNLICLMIIRSPLRAERRKKR